MPKHNQPPASDSGDLAHDLARAVAWALNPLVREPMNRNQIRVRTLFARNGNWPDTEARHPGVEQLVIHLRGVIADNLPPTTTMPSVEDHH